MSERQGTLPLSGQVALVTGASRLQGIGAAICRALAAQGADVALSHWLRYDSTFPWAGGPDEPDDLAAELKRLGARRGHQMGSRAGGERGAPAGRR